LAPSLARPSRGASSPCAPGASEPATRIATVQPYKNVVTFESMMIGFTEALNRLDDVAGDPILAYNGLFEALNWAVAIDERVGAHWVPDGKPLEWEWRDRLGPEARLMGGVRFARNRIHHQWSDAMAASCSLAGDFVAWIWRPVEDIPKGRPDPNGEAIYRDRLQGTQVQGALNVVGGAFLTLMWMLEPHTLRNPAVTSMDAVNPLIEPIDDAEAVWPLVPGSSP
jgi:hypothetical protein